MDDTTKYACYRLREKKRVTAETNDSQNVRLIYVSLCDAFCSTEQFYGNFLSFNMLLFVLITSAWVFFFPVSGFPVTCFSIYAAFNVMLDIVPMFVLESIKSNFQSIQTVINSFCPTKNLKVFELSTGRLGKWFYQCCHTEHKIDCGYFETDLSLLFAVFNFVTLILLATVPAYIYSSL